MTMKTGFVAPAIRRCRTVLKTGAVTVPLCRMESNSFFGFTPEKMLNEKRRLVAVTTGVRRLFCQVGKLKLETFRLNTLGRKATGGISPREPLQNPP